jgi:Tfp pilus assembly protein PilF
VLAIVGCGSSPSKKLEDVRRSANQAFAEGLAAFEARDFPTAEQQFSVALSGGGLDADRYCIATVKVALCKALTGNFDEATAALDGLGAGASNPDDVEIARSYIYKKQGKAAESRAALAKARKFNRAAKEFQ